MKEIMDKIKNLYNEKLRPLVEKVSPFVLEHKRYFGAGALFICFLLVLIFFAGPDFNKARIAKLNSIEVSGEDYVPDAQFEVNAYPELNTLIQTYFSAYVQADFVTMQTVATPISEMEKSYITTMSQFYDSYQNIVCYTKHGLSKDSFITAVRFDIKFAGQDVLAPSMMLFYVQTNEQGKLYINNIYSDFNLQYSEAPISKDVYMALQKFTTQNDYIELYNQVEVAFSALIKDNADIFQLTKRTIPYTRQMWEDSVFYATGTENVGGTESTETTESTESTVEPEDTQAEEPENTPEEEPEEEPEESTKVCVDTDSSVRVRKGPGTSYDIVGEAYDGDEFVKLGVEEDEDGDEWTKVQFSDDKVGYIKSSFLYEVE